MPKHNQTIFDWPTKKTEVENRIAEAQDMIKNHFQDRDNINTPELENLLNQQEKNEKLGSLVDNLVKYLNELTAKVSKNNNNESLSPEILTEIEALIIQLKLIIFQSHYILTDKYFIFAQSCPLHKLKLDFFRKAEDHASSAYDLYVADPEYFRVMRINLEHLRADICSKKETYREYHANPNDTKQKLLTEARLSPLEDRDLAYQKFTIAADYVEKNLNDPEQLFKIYWEQGRDYYDQLIPNTNPYQNPSNIIKIFDNLSQAYSRAIAAKRKMTTPKHSSFALYSKSMQSTLLQFAKDIFYAINQNNLVNNYDERHKLLTHALQFVDLYIELCDCNENIKRLDILRIPLHAENASTLLIRAGEESDKQKAFASISLFMKSLNEMSKCISVLRNLDNNNLAKFYSLPDLIHAIHMYFESVDHVLKKFSEKTLDERLAKSLTTITEQIAKLKTDFAKFKPGTPTEKVEQSNSPPVATVDASQELVATADNTQEKAIIKENHFAAIVAGIVVESKNNLSANNNTNLAQTKPEKSILEERQEHRKQLMTLYYNYQRHDDKPLFKRSGSQDELLRLAIDEPNKQRTRNGFGRL